MELKLTGKLFHHKRWVVARCPELDVASQGEDDADAQRMLAEAVRLFLEETAHKGTLKDILKEANLPVIHSKEPLKIVLDFGKGSKIAFPARF